jgi:hypothetical protein
LCEEALGVVVVDLRAWILIVALDVDSRPPGKPPVDSILVSFLYFDLWEPFSHHTPPLCPPRSFFFFGGLSIPVTQAIFAHLFSYNIQWSATVKEVERSNFFKEIPKIAKRSGEVLILSFPLYILISFF